MTAAHSVITTYLTGKLIRSEDEGLVPTGTMTKQTASRTAP
ncbi:hypothetical protein ACVXHB_26395 [Escherichia coli]